MFTDERGRLLVPHVLTHVFLRLARELELPPMHLHGLRGTAITHMLLQGIAPKTVADQVGHAKVQTTLDIYASVMPSQRDASADAIERLYGDAVTGS